ncbi:GNAT family N-acetyltransferase [Ideonella sp.]|uniref:GNAT family N-acetyltransferase n=1 Tax=Ideonella sp. TaxID=1929293 RepID=UPI0035B10114
MQTWGHRWPLSEGGICLRPLLASDLANFHRYRSDPEVSRYQGWTPMTEEAAARMLQFMQTVRDLVPGQWMQLGIADLDTDALLGDLGLCLDAAGGTVELGITLGPWAQGRGHATRAVQAVRRLLADRRPGVRLHAVTDARNGASIRLLERSGFVREGRREVEFKGEPCTEYLYVCPPVRLSATLLTGAFP